MPLTDEEIEALQLLEDEQEAARREADAVYAESLRRDREVLNARARRLFGDSIADGFQLGRLNAWLVDGRVFIHSADGDQFYLAIPYPTALTSGWSGNPPNLLVIEEFPVYSIGSLNAAVRNADIYIGVIADSV